MIRGKKAEPAQCALHEVCAKTGLKPNYTPLQVVQHSNQHEALVFAAKDNLFASVNANSKEDIFTDIDVGNRKLNRGHVVLECWGYDLQEKAFTNQPAGSDGPAALSH